MERWRRLSNSGEKRSSPWPDRSDLRWYFAYGANMSSQVLVERRGLHPLSGEAAAVRGYQLVFTTPGMWPEPAFANIEPAPDRDGVIHGVLYRVERAELRMLSAQEGPTYQWLEVEAHGSESGPVEALTYMSSRVSRGRLPSRRYLTLLRQGAAEWSLPAIYCDQVLGQQPSLHVPVISSLVTGVFTASGRLSRAGIRPELLLGQLLRRLRRARR